MDRAGKALADVGKGAEKLLWLLKGGGVGGGGMEWEVMVPGLTLQQRSRLFPQVLGRKNLQDSVMDCL